MYGNLTILEFSSKGGLPEVGGGGSLMTQSAGSVTPKGKHSNM
jgi:hypothetical protein